jgi:hypothetical protein
MAWKMSGITPKADSPDEKSGSSQGKLKSLSKTYPQISG